MRGDYTALRPDVSSTSAEKLAILGPESMAALIQKGKNCCFTEPKNVDAPTIKVMLEIWYRSVRMIAEFFNLDESFAYKT